MYLSSLKQLSLCIFKLGNTSKIFGSFQIVLFDSKPNWTSRYSLWCSKFSNIRTPLIITDTKRGQRTRKTRHHEHQSSTSLLEGVHPPQNLSRKKKSVSTRAAQKWHADYSVEMYFSFFPFIFCFGSVHTFCGGCDLSSKVVVEVLRLHLWCLVSFARVLH